MPSCNRCRSHPKQTAFPRSNSEPGATNRDVQIEKLFPRGFASSSADFSLCALSGPQHKSRPHSPALAGLCYWASAEFV
jgi:hypothetical protein